MTTDCIIPMNEFLDILRGPLPMHNPPDPEVVKRWQSVFTFGQTQPHVTLGNHQDQPNAKLQRIEAISMKTTSHFSRFLSWIHDNQAVVVALILLLAVVVICLAWRMPYWY